MWPWPAGKGRNPPNELLALSPSICFALLMKDTISPPVDCYAMDNSVSLSSVAALASPDSAPPLKPDDFAAIDSDANQMHNEDGQLFIVAFVSNDEPVTFKTSAGMFIYGGHWSSEWVCGSEEDEDCDGDGVRGDGVAVAWLWPCDSEYAAPTCIERSDPAPGTITVQQRTRVNELSTSPSWPAPRWPAPPRGRRHDPDRRSIPAPAPGDDNEALARRSGSRQNAILARASRHRGHGGDRRLHRLEDG